MKLVQPPHLSANLPTCVMVKIEEGSNDIEGKAPPCGPVVCGNRGKGKSHVRACKKIQGNTSTFEDETCTHLSLT